MPQYSNFFLGTVGACSSPSGVLPKAEDDLDDPDDFWDPVIKPPNIDPDLIFGDDFLDDIMSPSEQKGTPYESGRLGTPFTPFDDAIKPADIDIDMQMDGFFAGIWRRRIVAWMRLSSLG